MRNAGSHAPLTGSFPIAFTIYSDSAATDSLWGEQHASIPVNAGVFTVLLGSATQGGLPLSLFTGETRWIKTSVSGTALLPLRPIVSVPYALHALHADIATSAPTDTLWQADGAGNLCRLPGNVGIGTCTPRSVLDVVKETGSHDVNAIHYTAINPQIRLNATASGNHQFEIRFNKGGETERRWSLLNDVTGNDSQTFGLKNWVNNTVPWFVGGSGNVGIGDIGETNPPERLVVAGEQAFSGSAATRLRDREKISDI